jgi:hypothetical protein
MESEEPGGAAALSWTDSGWPETRGKPATDSAAADSAAAAVAVLYQHHAVGLIRLAYLMLGDRGAAEDAVQDAFCGLYRHWDRLADRDRALAYVRTSVLNGCRSTLRRRTTGRRLTAYQPPTAGSPRSPLRRWSSRSPPPRWPWSTAGPGGRRASRPAGPPPRPTTSP